MITSHIKDLRLRNLFIHGFVLLPLLVVYVLLLILVPEKDWIIHLSAFGLLILLLISLLFGIRKIKRSLVHKKIRVKEISHMIPYPQKFTDTMVDVGGFFKIYRYKKHMIPEYLIEFREGRILYLYQMVHEVNDECYTILRIYKFDIALVIDKQYKKRIVHLGNAELVD